MSKRSHLETERCLLAREAHGFNRLCVSRNVPVSHAGTHKRHVTAIFCAGLAWGTFIFPAMAESVSPASVASTGSTVAATGNLQPLIFEVEINGQAVEVKRPMMRRGTSTFVETAELDAWQIALPASPATAIDGGDYYDLQSLPHIKLRIDEATQTIHIDAMPEAFRNSYARHRSPVRPPVSDSIPGAFLNYDLALEQDRHKTHASGYFNAAVSGESGIAVTSFLSGQSSFGNTSTTIRLDSFYRLDDPDSLTQLTIGDAISRSAGWSTPFRYGGVQWGTRFALQPGYISYPTPTLRGSAALPSAVEVYVNDTLRYQGRTDAGPFAVSNVPVLTGAGEMRFATTDALGVQRVVVAPYYVSSNLLRAGLSDYSVEVGWTRLNYGQQSFDYGKPFGSGIWRRGINDDTTLELHGEVGANSGTGGGGLAWVVNPLGEFSVHAAASTDSALGGGRLLRTSFMHVAADWSFAASRQMASRGFTQIAWQESPMHVRSQSQVFAGRSFGRLGSLGTSYTVLQYSSDERVAVVTANWSIPVAQGGSLSAYVARTRQQPGTPITSVGLSLSLPLGDRQSASMSIQRVDGRSITTAEVSRPASAEIGGDYGYRVGATRGGDSRSVATVDWLGRYGAVVAEAASSRGDAALRVRASGAIGSAGGLFFAASQSDDAFALVTVPGAVGLAVYRENQHVGTTDSQGRAMLSGLRAYEPNRVSINSEDIPIDALVGADAIQVVPRCKGVAKATFDISRWRVANIVVRLPDDQPLPPGIEVRSANRAESFLSGFGGAVSISAPLAGERFEASWHQGKCTFTLGALGKDGQLLQPLIHVCAPDAPVPP